MTLQEHVELLADEAACTLYFDAPDPSYSRIEWDVLLDARTIHAAPIRRGGVCVASFAEGMYWHTPNLAYYAALHELGHAATGMYNPAVAGPERVLEHEAAAWDWAFDNALEPPRP